MRSDHKIIQEYEQFSSTVHRDFCAMFHYEFLHNDGHDVVEK